MMIAAFAGRDFIMQAYEEAMKNEYKFYSLRRRNVDFVRLILK